MSKENTVNITIYLKSPLLSTEYTIATNKKTVAIAVTKRSLANSSYTNSTTSLKPAHPSESNKEEFWLLTL